MEKLLDGHGQLISIEDVKILSKKPTDRFVLATEGIFHYIPKDEVKEILIRGGETEDLDDLEDEYHMILGLEKVLYQWFMRNRFDKGLMTIESKDMMDEILIINVKMVNKIWNYEYWIYLDDYGNIQVDEKDILVDKDGHDKRFGRGKYERRVDELEMYEREKYEK